MKSAKISKQQWLAEGAFSNPKLFRRMTSGSWTYWKRLD